VQWNEIKAVFRDELSLDADRIERQVTGLPLKGQAPPSHGFSIAQLARGLNWSFAGLMFLLLGLEGTIIIDLMTGRFNDLVRVGAAKAVSPAANLPFCTARPDRQQCATTRTLPMTAQDLQYWEALTLLRRLEKMSGEALRPVAPQILSLLRELGRFTQKVAEHKARRELSDDAPDS